MIIPRGLGRPGLEPIKRYGSWRNYIALLIISLLPFLIFFVGSVISLIQLMHHRTWFLWGTVIAGQLISYGVLYGQALQPHLKPLVRTRDEWAFVSIIDVGAAFLAHAAFATLCRLAWSAVPASPVSASSASFPATDESRKVLRDRRVGYLLLVPHALTPLAALWWPVVSSWTPFLQLPFCAYFATIAFEYRRLALEWGLKEGDEEDEDVGSGRPVGTLFDALVAVAGVMTLRSILGILAVALGVSQSPYKYVSLAYAVIVDDVLLFACFKTFWRHHPGKYLPPQLLSFRFNHQARKSYARIALG